MKKRLISLMLALCALILATLPACAAVEPVDGLETAGAFTDVALHAWYAEAVDFCFREGIMGGTSDTAFSPDAPMTRSMLAAVLHRMAGSPAPAGTPTFTDTEAGAWYAAAAAWAAEANVLSGYGNGAFGTVDIVTREQMAAVLWRYAGSLAVDTAEAFSDEVSISGWALPGVNWARAGGILVGRADNRFDPKAEVTRGETAAILYRYLRRDQKESAPPAADTLVISVGGSSFTAELEDNASAQALMERLPMTVTMGELNGNEKYFYLPEALPTDPERPGNIQAGDLMLYGSSCLVLFYESFASSYSYTRLGRIADPEGLADAVGGGSVEVTFQMQTNREQTVPTSVGGFHFETRTVTLNSGYEMPLNGLGTYSLTGETCVSSVSAALEHGVRLIDTAYMYHNEAEVGRAVRESGIPREEIFVITKLYPNQFANPEAAIDEALEKLDIGYIDLMLLHHPGTGDVSAYKAMEQAVAGGKVRSIGLSNWYVEELEAFLPQVTITPALVQNEIHPYYQENNVIPYIQSLGIVVQGWYPLGGRGHTAQLLGDEVISEIAEAHGKSSAQVILRWNLQKGVVVIPGSSNPNHILENTQLYDFSLTDEEMARINALDRGEKHDWY